MFVFVIERLTVSIVLHHFNDYFYRAMHVVLARYCYGISSICPSVRLTSVCFVDVPWAYVLG